MLLLHRIEGTPFLRFPPEDEPLDADDAYRVQDALHDRLSSAGWGNLVGHKIGCTTPVMQDYLRIDRPAGGGVFSSRMQRSPGIIRPSAYVRVGVECEIAVRIGSDLSADRGPYKPAELASKIGAVLAAMEIVDDRYISWPSLSAPSLIADDFFGDGCILGEEVEGYDATQLGDVRARMLVDGEEVGEGDGTEILGDPLIALAWLANTLADRGRALRTGEVVLLGSLVRTHWVEHGDKRITIENTPLGRVEAQVAR